MTTHINKIVQITRRMNDVDVNQGAPATAITDWQALQDQRFELVLTAIRDGVDADLIQWAIGMNDRASKVQLQQALAHLAAAEALAAEGR